MLGFAFTSPGVISTYIDRRKYKVEILTNSDNKQFETCRKFLLAKTPRGKIIIVGSFALLKKLENLSGAKNCYFLVSDILEVLGRVENLKIMDDCDECDQKSFEQALKKTEKGIKSSKLKKPESFKVIYTKAVNDVRKHLQKTYISFRSDACLAIVGSGSLKKYEEYNLKSVQRLQKYIEENKTIFKRAFKEHVKTGSKLGKISRQTELDVEDLYLIKEQLEQVCKDYPDKI